MNSFWQPLSGNKIAKKATFLVIHLQSQLLYKLIHRNWFQVARMAENKEAKMDLRLRPYKGKRPQLGKRVYVDPCATLVGDIELADDARMK